MSELTMTIERASVRRWWRFWWPDTIEHEVILTWDYQRAEPQTYWEPGCPEEIEIYATLYGKDIELTDREMETAEEVIREHMNEAAQDAAEYRAEMRRDEE